MWRYSRTENSGGQFWKRLRFTKACNAGGRRRIVTDIYCSMVNILYARQCCCQFRREEKSG
jgi:hypothetical protein